MSLLAKRELLEQVAPRYLEACRHQRRVILDEFVAATRYERKYAVRLLNAPARPQTPSVGNARQSMASPCSRR